MTDFATSDTALCLSLSCAEGWEVIVEQKPLIAFVEHIINQFLIKFGSERTRREALCLSASENRTAVRHWKRTDFAPDRTDLIRFATIETLALVKNTSPHRIAQHVIIIARSLSVLLFKLIGREVRMCCVVLFKKIGNDFIKGVVPFLFRQRLFRYVVNGLIELIGNLFAQFFVVDLVIIRPLNVLT